MIIVTMFSNAKTAQAQGSQKGAILPKCKEKVLGDNHMTNNFMLPCDSEAIGMKLFNLFKVLVISSLS